MRETIRLLHTADWHWGLKSWKDSPRSKDRNPEIRSALERLYTYAQKRKPDYILIAGDLFNHYTAPSESDAKEILSFLIDFSRIAPVLVVLGNHDWRGLATYHLFSSRVGIYILSSLGEPLEAFDGIRIFYFPYFPLRRLLRNCAMGELQDKARKLLVEYKAGLKRYAKNDKWNVLVGHLAVEGVSYQNEFTYASELFVPKDFFSSDLFDYVALGHIHSRRKIAGASACSYYSGSLVRVGFGEENNEVGALWVELKEGKNPHIEPIDVGAKILKTFTVSALEIDEVEALLKELGDEEAYVRVVVNLAGDSPSFPVSYYRNRVFSLDERVVKVVVRREERLKREKAISQRSGDIVYMFKEYLKMRGIGSGALLERFKYYYKKVEEDEAS